MSNFSTQRSTDLLILFIFAFAKYPLDGHIRSLSLNTSLALLKSLIEGVLQCQDAYIVQMMLQK